ncbi:hypothetical protein C8R44DRAFT_875202 [Mycena epipterygia]|nr:hypothetical protein C8R44DRAFT_875202 [Mycena epipterygia]
MVEQHGYTTSIDGPPLCSAMSPWPSLFVALTVPKLRRKGPWHILTSTFTRPRQLADPPIKPGERARGNLDEVSDAIVSYHGADRTVNVHRRTGKESEVHLHRVLVEDFEDFSNQATPRAVKQPNPVAFLHRKKLLQDNASVSDPSDKDHLAAMSGCGV